MALEPFDALIIVGGDADAENAFALTSAHGQQTVGRAAFEGFLPIEIITVFCGLVGIGFGLDDLRGDKSLTTEGITELLTTALVFADHLGDDVLSAFEGVFDAQLRVESGELRVGCAFGVALALEKEDLGEGLKALFAGHLCPGTAFGLVGQIDILKFGGIPTVGDALLQFRRQFV